MNMIEKNSLKISQSLFDFVNEEAIPGTKVNSEDFWSKFSKIAHELAPINKNLIEKRETIQKKIDSWHKLNIGKEFDKKEYINSWKIYGEAFNGGKVALINTNNTDIKITSISSWKIKPHPMETPMSSLL